MLTTVHINRGIVCKGSVAFLFLLKILYQQVKKLFQQHLPFCFAKFSLVKHASNLTVAEGSHSKLTAGR